MYYRCLYCCSEVKYASDAQESGLSVKVCSNCLGMAKLIKANIEKQYMLSPKVDHIKTIEVINSSIKSLELTSLNTNIA